MLIYILVATSLISLGALIGIFVLGVKTKILEKILLILVSFSAGTLMGGAFFHLLPESHHHLPHNQIYLSVLIAYVSFFLIETLLQWHHCHTTKCKVHTFGHMNLIGDAVHNFIDGLIIAAAFSTSIKLGLVTSIAVALHEIPQEIGDFGVLLHAGFKKKRALFLNFLVALTVVVGGLCGFWLAHHTETLVTFLVPFAAGGFIYIATTDLVPEIKHITNLKKSLFNLTIFLVGLTLMWSLTLLELH